MVLHFLLVACVLLVVESGCPPWTEFNSTSKHCECGSDVYGIVHCSKDNDTLSVSVQECYCMTYSDELNKTLLNYCFYTCHYAGHSVHIPVTAKNVSTLNADTCKHVRRTGVMCGECIAGHAPPVYSYSAACVECKDYKYNWIKYIVVAYLPLTLFYILIVLLKISVNSAPMIAYVTISQIISAPSLVRWYIHQLYKFHTYGSIVIAPLAIWNLDFFRGWYRPFCLHPSLSLLQVTCLDYIVGLYPLLLIAVTYCILRLHDRYVVISKLWKPVFKTCSLLRKEWNIRESLLSVFATFIILSYVKILNVSVDILTINSAAYHTNGNNANIHSVAINGSLTYFSREHIPFALCAIVMLIVFNLLPLVLLCLYPSSCFQKCLNLTGYHSQLLSTFMDAFQGIFKEKPRDCRYFAGYYVFLRLVNLVLLSVLYNPLYLGGISSLITLTVVLLAVCRPYKNAKRNNIDIALFFFSIMFCTTYMSSLMSFFVTPLSVHETLSNGIVYVMTFFLPLYGVVSVVYQVVKCFSRVTGCQCTRTKKREEEPLLNSVTAGRAVITPDM